MNLRPLLAIRVGSLTFRGLPWLALGLIALSLVPRVAAQAGAGLEFLLPTNGAVYAASDEVPVVLRALVLGDVILTAEVVADHQEIGRASFCCTLCPCAHPLPGEETILQIPVPWEGGQPSSRTWRGWTNVPAGIHELSARAVTENGLVVQAAPVIITVLDLTLRLHLESDGTAVLVIPQGSLVPGGYEVEASEDLQTWARLGPFLPGNVAAFYFDRPSGPARPARFYRSVYVRE
jgi:hypothetical protein